MAAAFGKRGGTVPGYLPARPPTAPAPARALPQPDAAAPAVRAAAPPWRLPLVTPFLLVLFCVVFAVEVHSAHALHVSLSAPTLASYGALEGDLVFRHGQVWRLFTAPLLHASLGHLIGNAVVFAIVGFMLEPLIGPRWFAGLFAIGGLGGAIASICINAADIPSVGASGAIMGVLGAAFFCGASAKAGPRGRRMQTWALRLILPALIPFAADSHTDFACHLGGLLAGLATGVLLQLSWARGEDRPAFGAAGAGIGAVSLAIALLAFLVAARPGSAAAETPTGLIPEAQMPADLDVDTERARTLLERYPHDPRAHLFRGFAFLKESHDLADAEAQFREALAAKDLPAAHLAPEFEKTVSMLLALTVAYQGRPIEARDIGAPYCEFAASHYDSLFEAMQHANICAAS